MKKLIITAALLALALLSLAFVQPKPVQWEYKTEHHGTMSEKKLNELGAEGWELVAIGREPSLNSHQTFYFKRQK